MEKENISTTRDFIYLDQAATSFPKPKEVCDALQDCMVNYCANAGRGGHDLSIKTGEEVYSCREALAKFLSVKNPMQIILTKNTTESLNLAILGIVKQGDHVITTSMEHNSAIRPLRHLERDGKITLTVVKAKTSGEVPVESILQAIQPKTRLVVMCHANNVTGVVNPVEAIGKALRKKGIQFLVDAAQTIGAFPVSVEYIDMLAFPGHKSLLGPQGTGGLYLSKNVYPKPLMMGGTGSYSKDKYQPHEWPDEYESGTLNAPGFVGLRASVEYIMKIGVDKIREKEIALHSFLLDGLSAIPGVTIYGSKKEAQHVGVLSFNLKHMDCIEVARILNEEHHIGIRAGFHCNGQAHETIGTGDIGTARVSFNHQNSTQELSHLLEVIGSLSGKKSS